MNQYSKLHEQQHGDYQDNKMDAREAMRVVFFCTRKTYLYARNKISYEYTQILF